jgi:hypothetical protein
MGSLKRHGTQDGAAWCHLGQLVNSKWDRTIVAYYSAILHLVCLIFLLSPIVHLYCKVVGTPVVSLKIPCTQDGAELSAIQANSRDVKTGRNYGDNSTILHPICFILLLSPLVYSTLE